jgi:hypothetical protein
VGRISEHLNCVVDVFNKLQPRLGKGGLSGPAVVAIHTLYLPDQCRSPVRPCEISSSLLSLLHFLLLLSSLYLSRLSSG